MELDFAAQSAAFLYSILTGAVFGMVYGCIRLVRTAFSFSKPMLFTSDVLFMLLSSVVIFVISLAYLSGHVRLYLIAGAALGFLMYRFTLGRVFVRLYSPLFIMLKRYFAAVSNFFKKIFKKLLKNRVVLLYNKKVRETNR